MEKIIIDTDCGVDDFFALLLAAESQKFDIQGITTVAGNCSINNVIKNVFKALDLSEKNDVLVYKGMENALNNNSVDATYIHGSNGLGNVQFEEIEREVEKEDAISFLCRKAREYKNEITLVAIGPLTNIAKAIKQDNEFVKNIKRLIVMGGSEKGGNITKYAEFNFYKDPEAAKCVFESEFKEIVMIGLDVTRKVVFEPKMENLIKNINDKGKFLYDISRADAMYSIQNQNVKGMIINDAVTISYLLDNSILELKNTDVKIITEGEKRGQSIIEKNEKSNHRLAYEIDSKKTLEILFTTLFKDNKESIIKVLEEDIL